MEQLRNADATTKTKVADVLSDAADEIERLREVVADLLPFAMADAELGASVGPHLCWRVRAGWGKPVVTDDKGCRLEPVPIGGFTRKVEGIAQMSAHEPI